LPQYLEEFYVDIPYCDTCIGPAEHISMVTPLPPAPPKVIL
jgi:hypothetical protein